jgi:hypothetical protein
VRGCKFTSCLGSKYATTKTPHSAAIFTKAYSDLRVTVACDLQYMRMPRALLRKRLRALLPKSRRRKP